MGKNVAVFVDVANIFYAAKAAGVDIDYVTLLKAATAGRDFVRAYAYTGLDPDNENQRNFHSFLARHSYKVVSKDIRKYGDGKVKANLDIELVVDLMKTARNLDVAIIVSGDGDFAPAIRAVQEMGVRVEVISFRGNTSSDLMEVADSFTDIAQVARVERGSSRSGRRVAGDDEDLSMTEVPDKQTEGSTTGRTRGRGRGRSEEAVAVGSTGRGRTRTRRAPVVEDDTLEPVAAASGPAIVALPGEKLSGRAAATARPVGDVEIVDGAAEFEDESPVESLDGVEAPVELDGDSDLQAAGRRRRRRGGRGRGRGRGRSDDQVEVVTPVAEVAPDDDEFEEVAAPRGPRPAAFGSIWDSQIGTPSAPRPGTESLAEEDEEEPAIPEYLIAEQRRRGRGPVPAGRGQGPRDRRGGRAGAYASAIERERYGGRPPGGGPSRYPDQGGRGSGQVRPGPRRDERPSAPRPERFERQPAQGRSDEPWSEVPPELEELLRAQVAGRPAGRSAPGGGVPSGTPEAAAAPTNPRRRGGRPAASAATDGATTPVVAVPEPGSDGPADAGPASSASRTRTRRPRSSAGAAAAATVTAAASEPAASEPAAAKPRRRTTASAGPAVVPDVPAGTDAAPAAKPAPRASTRRKPAATTEAGPATPDGDAAVSPDAPAPKRTVRRRAPTTS